MHLPGMAGPLPDPAGPPPAVNAAGVRPGLQVAGTCHAHFIDQQIKAQRWNDSSSQSHVVAPLDSDPHWCPPCPPRPRPFFQEGEVPSLAHSTASVKEPAPRAARRLDWGPGRQTFGFIAHFAGGEERQEGPVGTGPGSSGDRDGGRGRRAGGGRTTSQCLLWAPCREPPPR